MSRRRRSGAVLAAALVLPLLAACGTPESGRAVEHDAASEGSGHHAAAAAAGVWGLDVTARGEVVDLLLATGGHAEGEPVRLLHRRSADGGRSWSEAVEIPTVEGEPFPGQRGSEPQIAAAGDRLLVAWTARGDSAWGTGPLATAVSADGGGSWQAGANPADDGSTQGHGFHDLAATVDGRFHAVWLDGRDGDGQGLRAAWSADGLSWSPNATVDAATCECCWNRLLTGEEAAGELSVIYRDTGPRDLRVASLVGNGDGDGDGDGWEDRGTPAGFGWEFDGCPHVGGAIATAGAGGLPAALVWTGDETAVGLYAVPPGDGGWRPPVRLGGATARHGDLVASGGELVAVWDETGDGEGAIFAARSVDGGASWSAPERLAAGAGTSHPLAVDAGGAVVVVWTETAAGGESSWGSARLGG